MVAVLSELFGVIGLDMAPPATMSELIPYLFTVVLGMVLVLFFLRMFRGFANSIFGGRLF